MCNELTPVVVVVVVAVAPAAAGVHRMLKYALIIVAAVCSRLRQRIARIFLLSIGVRVQTHSYQPKNHEPDKRTDRRAY